MEIRKTIIKFKKDKWISTITLKVFILIVLLSIIIRIVVSTFFDLGFYNSQFHIGFASSPETAFASEYQQFKINNPGGTWAQFLDQDRYLKELITQHPHGFWNLTQFTWITTVFLLFVLIFRYLTKTNERLPNWLRWIKSQETLVLITAYELVVMVIFWGWIFQFLFLPNPLSVVETINSIIVHSIIPILTLAYLIIDLFFSKKSKTLKRKLPVIGIIYPAVYFFYYLIVAITWKDPYPISSINNSFQTWSKSGDSKTALFNLLQVFYIGPLAILGFYIYFAAFNYLHKLHLQKKKRPRQTSKNLEP